MTATMDRGELDRLMGTDRMARPDRPLGEGSARGDRDPRPSWDTWYTYPLAARRQLLRFMAWVQVGTGKVSERDGWTYAYDTRHNAWTHHSSGKSVPRVVEGVDWA
jgi:hypothetical protein